MEQSVGFIEVCLHLMNNNLKRFKLFCTIVIIPTLVAFVLVMWVLKPTYRATAIVTPPASSSMSLDGLGDMLGGGSLGSLGSMLGLASSSTDANAVWTILNSWELHDQVIEKFNLADHYEFDGKFHADLLKEFRRNFGIESNNEDMFVITIEDEDYHLAAQMVSFMLEKADSAFNAFKKAQAVQSRDYVLSRLDSCEHTLDSLLDDFVKFQVKNNVYDPDIQMEATLKYLSELQATRDKVNAELQYEKMDRGDKSKRYDELNKRYQGVNSTLNAALKGKNKDLGMIELKKSPELYAEYMRKEAEIKVQQSLYKLLRQQSEELRIEESKMLTNLHVLEPPWENDKKVFPLRGVTLMFTFAVAFLLATILCNFLAYMDKEVVRGSSVAKEWLAIKGIFHKSKG